MKYTFPVIKSIEDIEQHRDSGLIHDAFKRGERYNGTIVYDYAYMDNDVFPAIGEAPFAALARELRGITFDAKSGALISRPYQKFFNAGERDETRAEKLPLGDTHLVLEKLDGSMVHAFLQPDGALAFATRWGVTPIAKQALAWYETLDKEGRGRKALLALIEEGWTPIFEWTSPSNIVVVRHEAEALTLTGIRHRASGVQVSHKDLAAHALALGVPPVRGFDPIDHWEAFAGRAMAETEGEGYVVRFDDGHMIKIKNTLYARVHKFKAQLSQPKDAAEIVVSGALDDMLAHIPVSERVDIEAYRDAMFARLRECAAHIDAALAKARAEIGTDDPREKQKIFWMSHAAPLGPVYSTCAAEVWNKGADTMDVLRAAVLKQVATNPRFDAIAGTLGLPKLDFGFDGDQ